MNAIDDAGTTEWSSAGDGDDAFVTIDLGAERDIAGVEYITRSMLDGTAIAETFTVSIERRRATRSISRRHAGRTELCSARRHGPDGALRTSKHPPAAMSAPSKSGSWLPEGVEGRGRRRRHSRRTRRDHDLDAWTVGRLECEHLAARVTSYEVLGVGHDLIMDPVSAPTPHRPDALVFDVVETLFSLDTVGAVLERLGVGAEAALDLFFARMLRDAFALGSLGEYRPFSEFADGALAVVAPELSADDRAEVLAAFSELGVHPDVAPALDLFREAGVRIAALTNGSAANTTSLLERHGLADSFESVVSVDEVTTWKPQPAPYRYVADRLGLDGDRVAMVAVHAWDLHGARRAGLVTGWASRLEGTWADVFAPPDVIADDLIGVAEGLLGLPDRGPS